MSTYKVSEKFIQDAMESGVKDIFRKEIRKKIIDDLSKEVDSILEGSEIIAMHANRELTIEHRVSKKLDDQQQRVYHIEYVLDETNKLVFVNFKLMFHQIKLDYNEQAS